MKILIADKFPAAQMQKLRESGHEIAFAPELAGDALTHGIADSACDILVVRGTKVDAAALDAGGGRLQLVIRAGAGTNAIDKTHAASRDIRVCNVPGANAIAVAELVLGLLIAIDRNLAGNITDLRARRWDKRQYGKARGLHGMRLGILGIGSIGLAVAQRAHAFGMHLATWDRPSLSARARAGIDAWGFTAYPTRAEFLGACDAVSLHLPLSAETARMVDDDFLAEMPAGAILINTSRGDLVDEAALIRAMDAKGIRAGLDVYRDEPAQPHGMFDSALAQHPQVCGTHHIGASTWQAQNAVADGVLRVVDSVGGELLHCVNG